MAGAHPQMTFVGTKCIFSRPFTFTILTPRPPPVGAQSPSAESGEGLRAQRDRRGGPTGDRPTPTRNQASIITSLVLPHVITEQSWVGCL